MAISGTRKTSEINDGNSLVVPAVVFVLGGPGSGKGTHCKKISEKFGYTHLSAGDLLREERNRPGSDYGELIEKMIREGQIVPVEITVNLLKRAINAAIALDERKTKFLIDGFPRNEDNLKGWNELMSSSVDEKFCLFIDCPEIVMEQRLINRGAHSGRSDDNIESIRKRFATYVKDTLPVIEGFKAAGKLRTVRSDKTIEEVWRNVQEIFSEE